LASRPAPTAKRASGHDVVAEVGKRRVFASVLDWPGWCRSANSTQAALDALDDYRSRYAVVATRAGLRMPAKGTPWRVVEELPGDATTEFGAPGKVAEADQRPLTAAQAKRLAVLLGAAWDTFDDVVDGAPSSLRKGPRGGGRDRDKVVEHVNNAQSAYARKLGLATAATRSDIVAAVLDLGAQQGERPWPVRYAVRRIVWHVLDHAWEIEDRSDD
jgi:hypothetical protein